MATKKKATASEEDEQESGGGKMKLIIAAVVVLALAGGGYWFFLKPSGTAEAKEPEPGVVAPLEAIQINLADDHYLKLGLALQVSKEAGEHELDGSKALDAAIDLFSGRDMNDLAKSKYRHEIKKELTHKLEKLYHHEVIDVYFTDFVTQ
ncbi:MAG: flagellar basal body-associated FliL family protein [Nocardioidaceae bacterium]